MVAIYTDEGRITPNGSAYRYEYTIKDNLGNARISFADLNANHVVDVPSDILQVERQRNPDGRREKSLRSLQVITTLI